MDRIIVSTGNSNKLREIKRILEGYDVDVISKNDLGLNTIEIVEDGDTLEKNAIKKAKALWDQTRAIVIADDTGLFVSSLNGAPGVHSSRYAGKDGDDKANNDLLLRNMEHLPIGQREAYFKTVIAIIDRRGQTYLAEGICKGTIGFEEIGLGGFGYDPLFIVEETGKTFGQMNDEEKNKLSHRGKAIRLTRKKLEEILNENHDIK